MRRTILVFGLGAALILAPTACGRAGDNENEEMEEAGEAGETPAMEAAEDARASADVPADLLAKALIDEETARRTALESVENGTVDHRELEEENGLLIWSFDIRVPGKEGVQEVHVNALDGRIIKSEHESEATEAAEGSGGG